MWKIVFLELCNVAVVTYVPWKFVPQSGSCTGKDKITASHTCFMGHMDVNC